MVAELMQVITDHSPMVGFVAALLIGVFLLARYLQASEMRDMRSRIDYLDDQIRALRYRDQCYFEYVIYIEDYNRKVELEAVRLGFTLPKRRSFLQFRDDWVIDNGLEDEEEAIWTG